MPESTGRCIVCGKICRRRTKSYHSKNCGNILLRRILTAVPGVIDLLPLEWRKDLPGK